MKSKQNLTQISDVNRRDKTPLAVSRCILVVVRLIDRSPI